MEQIQDYLASLGHFHEILETTAGGVISQPLRPGNLGRAVLRRVSEAVIRRLQIPTYHFYTVYFHQIIFLDIGRYDKYAEDASQENENIRQPSKIGHKFDPINPEIVSMT